MQAFFFILLQILPIYLLAADITNCEKVAVNGKTYNISGLFTEPYKNISVLAIDREGISKDQFYMIFSLCSTLDDIDIKDRGNECTKENKHHACREIINSRDGDIRITSLKAYSDPDSRPKIDDSQHDNLVILLGTNNTIRITGQCKDKEEEPAAVSFTAASTFTRGTGGKLDILWSHKLFCGVADGKVNQGFIWPLIQWILTILVVYFVAGIAYNFYLTRGEMIQKSIKCNTSFLEFILPHQKFWYEVKDKAINLGRMIMERIRGQNSQYVAI